MNCQIDSWRICQMNKFGILWEVSSISLTYYQCESFFRYFNTEKKKNLTESLTNSHTHFRMLFSFLDRWIYAWNVCDRGQMFVEMKTKMFVHILSCVYHIRNELVALEIFPSKRMESPFHIYFSINFTQIASHYSAGGQFLSIFMASLNRGSSVLELQMYFFPIWWILFLFIYSGRHFTITYESKIKQQQK